MNPSQFFRLSVTNQLKQLYFDAVYVRDRIIEPFQIKLFLFGNHYYELWQYKNDGRLFAINYLIEADAEKLFPGKSESRVKR